MARQRMIQPEIWTDEGFLSLSIPARLVFIGMISGADDEGRGLATDRCLKARIFPADEVTLDQVRVYRDEVKKWVNVRIYEADGKEYYELAKWRNHQRLERPSKSTIPPSGICTGTSPESSGTLHPELKKELKKEEKEKKERGTSVFLTDEEYEKLVEEYGEHSTKAAVRKLSAYKLEKGKTYKSDYGAILSWAMRSVLEKGAVPAPLNAKATGPKFDLEHYEKTGKLKEKA